MLDLRNGDCLEILKDIPSKTIDLVFADLPYGQINCKWDCKIDLELLWKELLRVAKSDHTPFFFTATTKFGYELITSNKKMFKYDLVWAKSNPCGFLQAKKQPMRKHEMLYVFYKKQPAYDISSHKHKFKKEEPVEEEMCVIKEESIYGNNYKKSKNKEDHSIKYDPPLPISVIKEEDNYSYGKNGSGGDYTKNYAKANKYNKNQVIYDPPLPTSVIKEEEDTKLKEDGKTGAYPHDTKYRYDHMKENGVPKPQVLYDPPLPTSVLKEEEDKVKYSLTPSEGTYGEINRPYYKCENGENNTYDPPLPTSLLEIKSVRLKQHSTAKPPDLMKWILKYYSKEGDTILDPTMGSNPMGLACKEMNRKFIGIEMDETTYNFACDRVK